ncbi:right-handed parallel beta-helix repeat-containing protein [Methylocapsa sp. S129]|uniref:right-handed parallel beta-helix repeat-containing protein n=1 Tax=Methylocapsa sp. S129 TaxID=1641869 RepID=UPI00131CD05A|nr:right-handed parallel beta-helix repeat-containing protein [Methylocapsa sp. S129]
MMIDDLLFHDAFHSVSPQSHARLEGWRQAVPLLILGVVRRERRARRPRRSALVKTISLSTITGVLLASSILMAEAQSLNRAWVSGHGADAAGCGAPTSPCRSLQYVHDNIIAAAGEIDILDPAGYGAITITKAISIVNDDVGTAGVQQPTTGQNAITINAPTNAAVTLRGLNIDGLGVASTGIQITSAAAVTIANCVVRHFEDSNGGIFAQPSSGTVRLQMTDVVVSDNGGEGIYVAPTGSSSVTAIFKGVTVENNGSTGLVAYGGFTSGSIDVTVVDSIANANLGAGFGVDSLTPNTAALFDNVTASDNGFGLYIQGGAIVRVTRSTFTKNGDGAYISVGGGGAALSYQDNIVAGNTTDFDGSFTPASLQ